MFNQLLESKAKKEKMAGATVVTTILYAAVISLAVWATADAGIKKDKTSNQSVKFVEIKKEPPKPDEPKDKPPPPKEVVIKPPPPKGFQVLRAPVKIDVKIPEIDLSKSVTNEADFTGKGVKGGVASGVVGGTAIVTDKTYFEFQVEKPAQAASGNPSPRYPEVLKSSGVEGKVMAQFVVLETGRADMSDFKILSSDNDLFSSAVKNVLPSMRFLPAEIGGKKVRQLVQLPFEFKINR
ncbi:MAG: energy transducer TonB [Gemmatimonadota bacterium]|nr:energy transducer TonB [Gemmatimonadota bacterium]